MRLILPLIALLVLGCHPSWGEGIRKDAWTQVHVTVSPNLSMTPVANAMGISSVRSGPVQTEAAFYLETNQDALSLGVAVTHLYKGGVGKAQTSGNDPGAPPLAVDVARGVDIRCDGARPMNGGSGHLEYAGRFAVPMQGGDWEGWYTGPAPFQSGQNGHFSQRCTVSAVWAQPDPKQPQGQYSGLVVLSAAVLGQEYRPPEGAILPSP